MDSPFESRGGALEPVRGFESLLRNRRDLTTDDSYLRAQASASAWTITSAMRSGTSLGRKKTFPGTVTT